MAELIPIGCTQCGKHSWQIGHIPGKQFLKCPKCNGTTIVNITKDGHLSSARGACCFLATEIIVDQGRLQEYSIVVSRLYRLKLWLDRDFQNLNLAAEYWNLSRAFLQNSKNLGQVEWSVTLDSLGREFLDPILAAIRDRDVELSVEIAKNMVSLLRLEKLDRP